MQRKEREHVTYINRLLSLPSVINILVQFSYLDVSAELGGESFLLHIFDGSFTSEQINGHTRRQETLMLLPLQRLEEEYTQWN